MPIYEYRCDNGHEFEVIGKFSDDPLTECQVCGAPVVKVLHPPAIHFKGSGFHNTDYGTKKRNAEKAAHEKSKKDTATATASKTESKGGDSKKSDSKKSDSTSSPAAKKKSD
jgi:putative FmdB family regulatory protein